MKFLVQICIFAGKIVLHHVEPPQGGDGTDQGGEGSDQGAGGGARGGGAGGDPHFSVFLPSGKLLCFTVQGEHGLAFNLISSKQLHINAMFVRDSEREEVTWMGSLGIVIKGTANTYYQGQNKTSLKFDASTRQIQIGEKVTLDAMNIEKLEFHGGKLVISEATLQNKKQLSVDIDLLDLGLHFTLNIQASSFAGG